MFPLHTLFFGLRIKVMDPSFILGHNLMHKFLRVIFIERQALLRNIKPALLLIFGQHSGTHLAETLAIPKISVKIDWTAPKLMPISRRLLLLSHMIRISFVDMPFLQKYFLTALKFL